MQKAKPFRFRRAYSMLFACPSHVPADAKVTIQPRHNLDDLRQIGPEDVLVLHGGADISPSLYDCEKNFRTQADKVPSYRDSVEREAISIAYNAGAFIYGICRGAQLLCAYAGGTLVQHADGHAGGNHIIVDLETGQRFVSNTCHHQMMNPFNLDVDDYEILAVCEDKKSQEYHGKPDELIDMPCEPEIVWFPEYRGLGVQGHPEWLESYEDNPFVNHCVSLMTDLAQNTQYVELATC